MVFEFYTKDGSPVTKTTVFTYNEATHVITRNFLLRIM